MGHRITQKVAISKLLQLAIIALQQRVRALSCGVVHFLMVQMHRLHVDASPIAGFACSTSFPDLFAPTLWHRGIQGVVVALRSASALEMILCAAGGQVEQAAKHCQADVFDAFAAFEGMEEGE